MTSFVERHFGKILAGLWLLEVALLLFTARDAIIAWKVGDPDDQLRMVQVRDWLAGQSWSDVTQYRMNLPSGGDMHWSRLVDVPLGLAIVILTPIVGLPKAELWAAVIIPLLTLGIFLSCYATLVRTHFGSAAALASTAGLLTAVPLILQLVPLRVDHHGWQLVCMTLCLTFLLDQKRPGRSAVLLGIVSAIWLEISIEAFPYVVAFFGIFGLRWLSSPLAPNQSPFLSPFNILAVSAALASAALLVIMKSPAPLNQAVCDALSSAYVAAFLACALASSVLLTFVYMTGAQMGFWSKLTIGALGGVAALAVLGIGAPQCVGDSFQSLDPVVRRYWFNRTSEGLPIFELGLDQMVIASVVFLLGLSGIVHLLRSSEVSKEGAVALVLIFAATALVGTYVSRTLVYFIIVTSVIIAPLSAALFARISQHDNLARRLVFRVAAIMLLLPVMTGQLVANTLEQMTPAPVSTIPPRFVVDFAAAKLCQNSSSIRELRRLPPSNLLAGLDVSPGILQHTQHRVVASGHHRNQPAMRDVIAAFTSSPDVLASVLNRRNIDYVAVCAAAPEFVFYQGMDEQGNWARLNRGDRFEMLVERPRLGPFRIWEVRK